MAGLYIHIPFCASRCIYCGFYSTTCLDMRQQYVDAVCREMEMRTVLGDIIAEPVAAGATVPAGFPAGISTIYLGGGTPSQLTIPQLRQLFIYINKVYPSPLYFSHLKEGVWHAMEGNGGRLEVTIEVNPDDVTPEFATSLMQLGINRVSMGAQTFNDTRLQFLRRRHTAIQVREAVAILRDAGIHNISIDLMYGFPNETLDDWQRDIDAALALDVEHISAYCLMIEEGTVLYERLKMKDERLKMLDEETERAMYELLIDKLTAAGYEHYEISNFARPGYRSRHNSSYWQDIPYIGLGAAAHSYDGHCRSWNISDIRQYINAINEGHIPCECEILDDDTHYNDRIATALRTSDGLDLTTLSDRHRNYCMQEARCFLDDGFLILNDNRLRLTNQGLFVSDMVMSALMMV